MHSPGLIELFAFLWIVHVAAALGFGLPAWLLDRRRLRALDGSLFVVPFGLWTEMMLAEVYPKTLGNLAEAALLGAAIGVTFPLRMLTRSPDPRSRSWAHLAVACLIAVAICLLTPALPE